ncbi:MAG: zinc-ribbon domain-containing protein [Clostridia bacterium]|nr:zinc-ribbon domain-containing protein [Clostridia bacterium]
MFCSKCGNELRNNSIFCDKCGNKLVENNSSDNNISNISQENMKQCQSCNKPISVKATICPHCGRDDRPLGEKNPVIGCIAVILLIIGFLLLFNGTYNITLNN